MIIHDDAAIYREAGRVREFCVGFDADRDDDHFRFDLAAVLELHRLNVPIADETAGRGFEQDLDALRFDGALQERSGAHIELTFHQPIHEVNQRDLGAGFGEAIGSFDAQQPAADHDDARAATRRPGNRLHVGQVAERQDAAQIAAFDRQADGARAGGEDELGERRASCRRRASPCATAVSTAVAAAP